jgi:sulfane dehydrogenase subunit SoxC
MLPAPGSYVLTGLAWSGGGVIRRVDVSVDGGKTYRQAEITGAVLSKAFTRFQLPWKWNGEEAVIQSRCVDEKGQVQPTEEEFAKYWNMSRRQLYATIQSVLGHCNWIQAWRVNPNGKVTNGLPPVGAIADVHG